MRIATAVAVGVGLLFAGPAAADSGCANGQPDAVAASPDQQVIIDYFHAVNDRNYGTAWGYLAPSMHEMYGTLSNFVSILNQHVKCVRVTNIAPVHGTQWYQVTFDDEYFTPFEAGAGTLPLFYKTRADQPFLITDQGTGP